MLNDINPHFIRLRTFHLVEGTPIYEKAAKEEFHLHSVLGVLNEIRRFVELLEVSSDLVTSDYAFNFFLRRSGWNPSSGQGKPSSID